VTLVRSVRPDGADHKYSRLDGRREVAHREQVATETPSGAWKAGTLSSVRATHATPAGSGYVPSPIPHDLLAGVFTGHRRLLSLAAAVDDRVVARSSSLPGWTVGRVLSHLAQDAYVHAAWFEATAAAEPEASESTAAEPAGGEPAAGEPSGGERDTAQPAAEPEAAARPATVIRDDLAGAIATLERAWDHTHVDAWRAGIGYHRGAPISLADLVFVRWREVEVHLVDLGLVDRDGPGWADLPAAYVDAEWVWSTARLPGRLPPEVTVLLAPGDRPSRAFGSGPRMVTVRASTQETLRWLLGRLPTAAVPVDWPRLAPSSD